jgi:group I intron endonuclease
VNVYCIYFPNGKRYVGIESTTGRRIREHKKGANLKSRNVQLVTRAIRKHGWDACRWRYLATNTTKHEGFRLERFFIKYFESQDPEKGYNIGAGGEGGSGMAGVPLKDETKRKISESLKGRYPSQETREKYRIAGSRPRPWLRGRPNHRRMPVVCMETGDIYPSITEAAQAVGISGPTTITACCNGRRKMTGGYHWSSLIKLPQ